MSSRSSRGGRRWPILAIGMLCGLLAPSVSPASAAGAPVSVAEVAGFTKIALSPSYIVVVNVLPPERMFSPAEVDRFHPTKGEMVVDGRRGPIRRNSRHVEAHLYSRATGAVVTDERPVIRLVDHTLGRTVAVDATLMQDVVIGIPDRHFGTNIVVAPGHRFTLHVRVGNEEVSVDGQLP